MGSPDAPECRSLVGGLITLGVDLPTPSCPAFPLLIEWLAEDIRDGIPWNGATFGYHVVQAVRATGAGKSWIRAIVECAPAWRAAYEDQPGHLASFGHDLLDDRGADPRFDGVHELIRQPGF